MATARRTYKARVRFRKSGSLPRPQFNRAITSAQAENAALALERARLYAQQRVKNSPSLDNRGRRRYAGTMVGGYRTRLIRAGRAFSLRNLYPRGRMFETGTRAHVIRRGGRIEPGHPLRFRSPKPDGPWRAKRVVNHPGQRGRWPMRDAIRHLDRRFGRNISEAVGGELEG